MVSSYLFKCFFESSSEFFSEKYKSKAFSVHPYLSTIEESIQNPIESLESVESILITKAKASERFVSPYNIKTNSDQLNIMFRGRLTRKNYLTDLIDLLKNCVMSQFTDKQKVAFHKILNQIDMIKDVNSINYDLNTQKMIVTFDLENDDNKILNICYDAKYGKNIIRFQENNDSYFDVKINKWLYAFLFFAPADDLKAIALNIARYTQDKNAFKRFDDKIVIVKPDEVESQTEIKDKSPQSTTKNQPNNTIKQGTTITIIILLLLKI